jgi:hypothetical protein
MSIAPKTVANYTSAIFTKLQFTDPCEAVVPARHEPRPAQPGQPGARPNLPMARATGMLTL